MSKRLALVTLLWFASLTMAAPVPSSRPVDLSPPGGGVGAEELFAQQLLRVAQEVCAAYVRPVNQAELLTVSMTSLYEAARLPVSDRLEDELARARNEAELFAVLEKHRQAIGNPDSLRGRNALLICCQGMTRKLDPHSVVVTAEQQRKLLGLDQEGRGLGFEIEDQGGSFALRVRAVHPGGPAQKAGLRPGDRITHLDGKPVREYSEESILLKLFPPMTLDPTQDTRNSSTPVSLTYERPGCGSIRLLLMPTTFEVEYVLGMNRNEDGSWNHWVDRGNHLALVRLASLGRGSSRQLVETLSRLSDDGMRGLILDLRWCPGGYLDEAVDAARVFLDKGIVATKQMRNPNEDQVYEVSTKGPVADLPLVVLVNGDTSGGGELIAAALQDHGRALMAGQRTLGKGSVQGQVYLGIGQMGMKLTSGTFIRPNGTNLHRFPDSKDSDAWGVRPDEKVEFRVSPELSRTLRDWWIRQTLRPGTSNERLPLDDPKADPQLRTALDALRDQVEQARRKTTTRAD